MKIRYKYYLIAAIFFLVLIMILSIGIGAVTIRFDRVINILLSSIGLNLNDNYSLMEYNIVINLRIPRVVLGSLVGASLAVVGVVMQALIRNKLADPFILGVSSGASAFATLGMIFGIFNVFGTFSLPISAFLGATITILFVYSLSRTNGKINISQLLLSGVAISLIMDGITKFITLSAPNALGLHNATFWMSGSLASAKWDYLVLPIIILFLCMIVLMVHHRSLNVLLFQEENAITVGVNVKNIQKLLILIASLMTGVVISVSGTIGFIGLMVPHFTRLLVGSDHKKVLPISALLGAMLVVVVDIIARTIIAPEELPVGILTAIIGGPIFILLLRKEYKGSR